jgi:hypothetical protein
MSGPLFLVSGSRLPQTGRYEHAKCDMFDGIVTSSFRQNLKFGVFNTDMQLFKKDVPSCKVWPVNVLSLYCWIL